MIGKDLPALIIFTVVAFFFLKWARDAWRALHRPASEPTPN